MTAEEEKLTEQSEQPGAGSELSSEEESDDGESDTSLSQGLKDAYGVEEMRQFLQKTGVKDAYGLEAMKQFLQKTKNYRVTIGQYFPDKKRFIEASRRNMRKKGNGGFTEQEVYRLKKFMAFNMSCSISIVQSPYCIRQI